MVDNTLALNVRAAPPVDYAAQIGQRVNMAANLASLQGEQVKLDQANRQIQNQNAMTALLQGGFDPSDQGQVNHLIAIPGGGDIYKQMSEGAASTAAAGKDKAQAGEYDQNAIAKALENSRSVLDNINPNDPQAAQQLLAWHAGNHADPVLGPFLAAHGVDPTNSAATIQNAAASGTLPQLIQQSSLGLQKFTELNAPKLTPQSLGGTTRVLATPGLGGAATVVPGSEGAVTNTPYQTGELAQGAASLAEKTAADAASQKVAQANLGLRAEEMNRARLAPPTTVEHIVNGEPVQVTAMFDNKTGSYVDMTGHTVDPTGLRVIPGGGSRATLGLLRVSTAAADAATGIENLSKLPGNSALGWFSQAQNTPVGALKRVLTPQEAQDMRTTMAGLGRAMGGLATGGLSVDGDTQKSYEGLTPQAGQTRLTALRQMGEMRQQAENGIESALANPYVTPAQKTLLQTAQTKIQNAVPWTPTDISNLEASKNNGATMRSMGVKTLAPVQGKAPAKTQTGATVSNW